MSRRTILLSIVILAVVAVGAASVSYFFVRAFSGGPRGPFVPSQSPGAVVPIAQYQLTGPYTHENLAVFLVHGPETLSGISFLTLQEALERKLAVVAETGSVNRLTVENLSEGEELFVQSGDIVKGGKQDRTLPYDAVIAAKSGVVPVDAFCVEQGRWQKRGKESFIDFGSSSFSLSTSDLKRSSRAPGEASQSAVWASVARTQDRLAAKLGTTVQSQDSRSSLQLTLESPAVRNAIAAYLKPLGALAQDKPNVIGCVVVIGGRAISADVYASGDLFRKVWPKLLEGAAVEAFLDEKSATTTDADVARTFLASADETTPSGEAVTERTYVQSRSAERIMVFDSCDRKRDNLVLHRSYLAK